MCLSVIGTQFEKAAQTVESSVTAMLHTADEFAAALKATAIKAGGSLNAALPEHQKAYEYFMKMTFAYYTVLSPHKEHEYHQELGRFSEVNMKITEKHKEFKATLKAGGVGSPRSLFQEVDVLKSTLTLESSSSAGPWRLQEQHPYTPKTEEEVRSAAKGLFNSFRSIDECLNAVEKLRRDMARARGWCGASKEVLAEVGVGLRASSVQSCYLDSHLVRELLPEAKEHREEAWAAQVKKAKDELNEMVSDGEDGEGRGQEQGEEDLCFAQEN